MGLYPCDCSKCKKPFMWFSGDSNKAQLCDNCRPQEDDDSVVVKLKPVTFDHEVVYYVPVFQRNFREDGSLEGYPTFQYGMDLATSDEQMAWSFDPDYVLELKGHFKATTKPFKVGGSGENRG